MNNGKQRRKASKEIRSDIIGSKMMMFEFMDNLERTI